jgi:hypothetical protein
VIKIRPGDFTTGEKSRYQFSRRLGALQRSWSGLKNIE